MLEPCLLQPCFHVAGIKTLSAEGHVDASPPTQQTSRAGPAGCNGFQTWQDKARRAQPFGLTFAAPSPSPGVGAKALPQASAGDFALNQCRPLAERQGGARGADGAPVRGRRLVEEPRPECGAFMVHSSRSWALRGEAPRA